MSRAQVPSGGNMKGNPHLHFPKRDIRAFCRRYNIQRLSLFGSVLTNEFRPDSDVDVLVIFEPGHSPSFFELFDMEEELSAMLRGRKVDLRTPEDLSRYFRDEVLRNAVVEYAAG